MQEFWVGRIGLKINGEKTKSLRQGTSEGEKVMLNNNKFNQVGSFTYLSTIICKDRGAVNMLKVE